MRLILTLGAILAVMALAFWAYRENYRTQDAVTAKRAVQAEIATLREELSVLTAEWAWLNRPERLRELVDLNHERLKLVPMTAEQMVPVDRIPYPTPVPTPEPAPETTPETTPTTETRP